MDFELTLNWLHDGAELRAATESAPGGRVNNEDTYFETLKGSAARESETRVFCIENEWKDETHLFNYNNFNAFTQEILRQSKIINE